MASEEILQRGYIKDGKLVGEKFGRFELLNLGATTANELQKLGVVEYLPSNVDFPFEYYKPPIKTSSSKVDGIVFKNEKLKNTPVASIENKKVSEFNTSDKQSRASEQALYTAAVLNAPIAVATDTHTYIYIDVEASLKKKTLVYFSEHRELTPGVMDFLMLSPDGEKMDAGPLAEKVWQAIWHATKEEPKQCLMTFVEIFILKFLADNLSTTVLPERYSFYELTRHDAVSFQRKYGKTQIEYYVQDIRPHIKSIIPEKTLVSDQSILDLFGLSTIVSPASVINGFAFLQSGTTSLPTFNRTFTEILGYFEEFGLLINIDPEFKLRLYETFLKKTAHQSKLGQFFTPRNVVKAIVSMAELNKLPEGSVVLDPAAGVGGFLLEPLIDENGLKGNIVFENGQAKQKVKLVGLDVDVNTSILAKANTLIHLSEFMRDPHVTMKGLNELMAEMFHVFNSNQHLGSLEYPVRNSVDVVLTNPPYVTQGSKIYKDEILNTKGLRNGVDIKDYYDKAGLGLESLFLRYISGSLKPGGYAYVIVPQGLLTRTDKSTKAKLLSECNLRASIALPPNTFFNTPQKTYILVLQKRRTKSDTRPDVFCGISSSIGESLDARRVSTPSDNTLQQISDAFRAFKNRDVIDEKAKERIKSVKADQFTESDRWDIQRFWSDEELVLLGAREEAVDSISFIENSIVQITTLNEDFAQVMKELAALEESPRKEVSISDTRLFTVRRGKRVTRKQGDLYPGSIPVYSGSKDPLRPICMVSEEWASSQNIPIETKPIITINANGYVGACFVRREKCIIHDDVMIVELEDSSIDIDYLALELRSTIAAGNFEYEAKLYNRVKELKVQVPINSEGFDMTQQRAIADTYKRFDAARSSLSELGKWASNARLKLFGEEG